LVYHDEATALTAMQRCTGFDAAIVAAMMARGEIAPEWYVAELGRRGMKVTRKVTELPDGPASTPRRPG
jgi:saccharopine dehydrogenase-like NADP-dependent oxidoreductase